MEIVKKLKLVDATFWYKPLRGIDTDLDVPAYELGELSHNAATAIENLATALEKIATGHYNADEMKDIARITLKEIK
jgi:hypothetical protein